MLSLDELNEVKNNAKYRRSKNPFVNLKHTRGIHRFAPPSVDVKFSFNEKFSGSVNVSLKFIANLFKPLLIAKEMGEIRNEIVEIFLNDTIEKAIITDILVKDTYYWMEYNEEKLDLIRIISKEFLSDCTIEEIILNACKHLSELEKTEQYRTIINDIEKTFSAIINDCKKKKDEDICIDYIVRNGLTKRQLLDIFVQHAQSGLLTDETKGC